MTGERHGCLMTSVVLLSCLGTLWLEPVVGSPMGQYHKPWESWEDFFGHSFRREEHTEGTGDVSTQNDGCLPACEQEGTFYADRTSCNHFFVCTNNFKVGDKSPGDLLREPTMTNAFLSENLKQGSDDIGTLSIVRCSCPGKRDVYNRYLQRCSMRGHCRVSCTAQGNVFGNWTSVTYNGYQCSVASLSVNSSSTFHTTSKIFRNGESAASEANEARGNLPEEVYQIETNHPEMSEGAEYTHGPPDAIDQVTFVPLSSDILNIQTYSSASVIISATALPATIQLPIILTETTQFPVTESSPFQETGSLIETANTTADFQEITHDILTETISVPDTLSVTVSAVNTKPGTIKTPVLLPTQTSSPDYIQIAITPDITTFIIQQPLTLPAHIPVTEEFHRPVTLTSALLPETVQYPDAFPATSQNPVILPATILKPPVLLATIQKPAILPGTIQLSTMLPAPVQTPITQPIIPKPAVFPEITEIPMPLLATSQTPTVLPATIQKPVVLPELIQKPIPLPSTSQIPMILPATIQKPDVLPESVSNSTDLSGTDQLPAILPETIQMPFEVPTISITPSLLPATSLTPATLPLVITEPGSMSEQTSLTEMSLTPTTLPDFQDPSKLPANNPSPVILPATIQKPATPPAFIQTVSASLETGQTSHLASSVTQIPVVLPATIETLQTTRPLTMVNTNSQTVMTLPAIVQTSVTQTVVAQKPAILPETIGTFTSSSGSLPSITLPGIIQTTQISPSFTPGSVSNGISQIHDISSTNQVPSIQSPVILPTATLMGESSSTILLQAMQTSIPSSIVDLKPATCRAVKCRVANTRFPNPKDCTRYYKCVMHRGRLVARPYICPSVMPTFSPSLMMCLRGIKCQPTCRDEELPEISSSSVMTTRIDNMQG